MAMKEIRVVIAGGKAKILAEGPAGKGTAGFTEKLAKDLGEIEERHKGVEHVAQEHRGEIQQGQG